MERTIDESRMCQKKRTVFSCFFVLFNFQYFFFRRRSRSMPFFGCSACLTVCYHENKEVTRSLSQGWAPNFRLKTLAENNWMFDSKYCNLGLERRTIFPVPFALLKLAALLLSCLMHIQIGVFLNWKKMVCYYWKITTKATQGMLESLSV